jgi:hypothetical protein
LFTILAAARYDLGMVIFAPVALATAALAATLVPQAQAPVAPQRQAEATVTILSSAQVRFTEIERDRPNILRETRVRAADGSVETVKLVEFQ